MSKPIDNNDSFLDNFGNGGYTDISSTDTSKPTTLNEMLDDLWVHAQTHQRHRTRGAKSYNNMFAEKKKQQFIAEVSQQLLDLLESKVIGEDETVNDWETPLLHLPDTPKTRNQLRHTQRQALKELGDK
jgi:hypothetical protein